MTQPIEWTSGGVVETPTWFGPEGSPLFGWLARPAEGDPSAAVLLCAPIGEEARSARRTLRELARTLAAAGALVLRFDYHGTGDSAGDLDTTAGPHSWAAGVHAALAFLRACGAGAVSVVGMRMGATIAAAALAEGEQAPEQLILWDPCLSGRQFVREQSMLHRAAQGEAFVPTAPRADGGIEISGALLNAGAAAALTALKLGDLPVLDRGETDVTILVRDGRTPAPAIARFAERGATVRTIAGQEELLDVTPVIAETPTATVALIADLLARTHTPFALPTPLPVRQRVLIEGVTESAARVGDDLFAIRTEPRRAIGSTAVFFDVGTECHIGPARLWVTLARQWAFAQGRPGLRVDFTGVGDSPDGPGGAQDVQCMRIWIDDADRVVEDMAQESTRVLTVGLCASAYAGFEAGLRHPDVDVIGVNPLTDQIDTTRAYMQPHALDKRRRGYRRLPRPLMRLAGPHGRTAWLIWRAIQQLFPPAAAMAVVGAVRRRGGRVLLVLGPDEARSFAINPYWQWRRRSWARRGTMQSVVAPQIDHSLKLAAGRDLFIDAATTFAGALPGERRAGVGSPMPAVERVAAVDEERELVPEQALSA